MTRQSDQNVLSKIIEHKRLEVAEAKRLRPLEMLVDQVAAAPGVRDFAEALRSNPDIGLIAEVKKGSPSAGGTVNANPTSADGYYASGAGVLLSAVANGGFQFNTWSGDLSGTATPQPATPEPAGRNAPRGRRRTAGSAARPAGR